MRDKYQFVPDVPINPVLLGKQGEVNQLFLSHKANRKRLVAEDQEIMRQALVNGADSHTVLHSFEKNYLEHGGNWGRFKRTLGLRFGGSVTFHPFVGYEEIHATAVGVTARIGTVFLEQSRFMPLAIQPLPAIVIYQRREDPSPVPRHYLLLPGGTYIRRYVSRGLNGFDGMRITAGQPLLAAQPNQLAVDSEVGGAKHAVPIGGALTLDQQVLSHTRGWGGNKRFISTGVSNHPAYSTRGEQFISMYGLVTIDLALVPQGSIVDVHTPAAGQAIMGIAPTQILTNNHHTGTNDLAEQQYLALRDVIRTRELLIHATIPLAAVQRVAQGYTLLALGSQTQGVHTRAANVRAGLPPLIQGQVVKEDHNDFREKNSNRLWHYLEFTNPVACQIAFNNIVAEPNQLKIRFQKFSPVRPPGMN
jgi:hypothetical protein